LGFCIKIEMSKTKLKILNNKHLAEADELELVFSNYEEGKME